MGRGEGERGQDYLRPQGLHVTVFPSAWSSGSTDSLGGSLPLPRKILKPLLRATSWRRPWVGQGFNINFSAIIPGHETERAVKQQC